MHVILLLSGGKDSRLALERLLRAGHSITALCVGGKQGAEIPAASAVAVHYGVELRVMQLNWYDEETYSAFQLICRNVLLLLKSIQLAWWCRAKAIATGTKRVDSSDRRLFWIPYFIGFCIILITCLGLKAMLPVWDEP